MHKMKYKQYDNSKSEMLISEMIYLMSIIT